MSWSLLRSSRPASPARDRPASPARDRLAQLGLGAGSQWPGQHRSRPRVLRPAGQALPEFALVLPILILILGAILQFGILFSSQIGLTNAVREAARYASVLPVVSDADAAAVAPQVLARLVGQTTVTTSGDTFSAASCPSSGSGGLLGTYVHPYLCSLGAPSRPGLVAAIVSYCKYQNPSASGANPTYSVRVSVTVTYNHPLILPVIAQIIDGLDGGGTPGSFQLSAGESMRVENQPTLDANALGGLSASCS